MKQRKQHSYMTAITQLCQEMYDIMLRVDSLVIPMFPSDQVNCKLMSAHKSINFNQPLIFYWSLPKIEKWDYNFSQIDNFLKWYPSADETAADIQTNYSRNTVQVTSHT